MNAYAYFIVNHNLDDLLGRADRQRRVYELDPRPSLRARIASAVAGLRRLFDPADFTGPALPNLEDYPYRS